MTQTGTDVSRKEERKGQIRSGKVRKGWERLGKVGKYPIYPDLLSGPLKPRRTFHTPHTLCDYLRHLSHLRINPSAP